MQYPAGYEKVVKRSGRHAHEAPGAPPGWIYIEQVLSDDACLCSPGPAGPFACSDARSSYRAPYKACGAFELQTARHERSDAVQQHYTGDGLCLAVVCPIIGASSAQRQACEALFVRSRILIHADAIFPGGQSPETSYLLVDCRVHLVSDSRAEVLATDATERSGTRLPGPTVCAGTAGYRAGCPSAARRGIVWGSVDSQTTRCNNCKCGVLQPC
jgi:hypothetical protein